MAGLSRRPTGPLRVVQVNGEAVEPSAVDGLPPGVALEWTGAGRGRLHTRTGRHGIRVVGSTNGRPGADGQTRLEVVVDGWRFEVEVEPEDRARLRERATSARDAAGRGGPLELRAIIPGRVVSVDVANGDTVEAGGRLLVIEAMKMQNELRAPRGGTVGRLSVGAGQTVERGDLLLVVE